MTITDLHGLLVNELQDVYSAEEQIVDALPKMITAASEEKLVAALSEHRDITKQQIKRLEGIAKSMGWKKGAKGLCEGVKSIIKEGEVILKKIHDPATQDAAIIAAAQKIEHYEMSVYGSLVQYARQLDLDEVAELLAETLQEEKEADNMLTKVAQGGLFTAGVNEKAAEMS